MERDVHTVVRHLAALPDGAMRRAALADLLAPLPASDAVRLVGAIYATADPIAVTALAGLLAEDRISYQRLAELYEAAVEEARPMIARLFLESHAGEPPPSPEQPTRPGGPTVPLGRRKALARDRRRDLLAPLLRDPDVAVVRNLLANRYLTERDVVAMAARRPARADVLRAIAASRWVERYHVKRALVWNPSSPRELALRLLAALNRKDRDEVARDPGVSPDLREQARALGGG